MSTDQTRSLEFIPCVSSEIEARIAKGGRVRIETQLRSGDEVAGTLQVTVARGATPTAHEKRWVWGHDHLALTNGVFVRRLHVTEAMRGQGFGSLLMHEATKLGRMLGMKVHMNSPATNERLRKFLRANGFSESIFWFTPKHILMVRYLQM